MFLSMNNNNTSVQSNLAIGCIAAGEPIVAKNADISNQLAGGIALMAAFGLLGTNDLYAAYCSVESPYTF